MHEGWLVSVRGHSFRTILPLRQSLPVTLILLIYLNASITIPIGTTTPLERGVSCEFDFADSAWCAVPA